MILSLPLAIFVALALGLWLLLVLFPPCKKPTLNEFVLNLALALAIGIGVTSLFLALWMLAFPQQARFYPWGEGILTTILWAAFYYQYRQKILNAFPSREAWRFSIWKPEANAGFLGVSLMAVLGIALVIVLVTFVLLAISFPLGRWDAYMIWNLHARFIFRGGELWHSYMIPELGWSNPNYPLLLPFAVARCWFYVGSETLLAPIALAGIFFLALLGTLVAFLKIVRNTTTGYLGGLFLLGTPFLVNNASWQNADMPLALFFLLAMVAFFLSTAREERGQCWLILAGFLGTLAISTKNEGWLFFLVLFGTAAAFFIYTLGIKRMVKKMGFFLLGALPLLPLAFLFSVFLTPADQIFANGVSATTLLTQLTDSSRWSLTLASFTHNMFFFSSGIDKKTLLCGGVLPLLVYAVLSYRRFGTTNDNNGKDNAAARLAGFIFFAVVILMTAGYFFIYLITPYDLKWHLTTSNHRIFLQIYPILVAAVMLCFPFVQQHEKKPTHTYPASKKGGKRKKS